MSKPRPMAFVLLAHDQGGESWNRRWRMGQIIGLNEPFPYGYHHAADNGVEVVYSEYIAEGRLAWFWRMGWRAALGFDIMHAWRNRQAFFSADAVWTHTESQSLAAALLCVLSPGRPPPKLILQSVWLADSWDGLSAWKKWLWKQLLSRADILSFLSPLNRKKAQEIFPDNRCELILFGIRTDEAQEPGPVAQGARLQVLAVGTDIHRDWATLVQAIRAIPEADLCIVSRTCPAQLVADSPNAQIVQISDNAGLTARYRAADVVVVPLEPNLHASGITVIEEGVVQGRPVIASRTGGLEAYFPDDCLIWVPPADVAAMTAAIRAIARDPQAAQIRARRAQDHMAQARISSRDYARRHAEWTHELLSPKREADA